MALSDYVTTKEAAGLLKVSHYTISAWLSQGKLQRFKAGARTLLSKTDLEKFIEHKSGRSEAA